MQLRQRKRGRFKTAGMMRDPQQSAEYLQRISDSQTGILSVVLGSSR